MPRLPSAHDLGAHSEEDLGGLVLREEVREVVDGAHVWDDDLSFLDDFADVEVAARDVLRALVELRVVGEVVRRLVVPNMEREDILSMSITGRCL